MLNCKRFCYLIYEDDDQRNTKNSKKTASPLTLWVINI
jgi:hypothetical protein